MNCLIHRVWIGETVYGLLKNNEHRKVAIPSYLLGGQQISDAQQPLQRYVLPGNRNHILALDRYSKGILKDIDEIDCFIDAFGGVCVSAEYLANLFIRRTFVKRRSYLMSVVYLWWSVS